MADSNREADLEVAKKDLNPRELEILEDVLDNHPRLSVKEALEMLRYFGL